MKTFSSHKSNKRFNDKNMFLKDDVKGTCIIEYFLNTGRIQGVFTNLNSKREDDIKKRDTDEYVEIERPIQGTNIVIKEKIIKINDIIKDVSRKNFEIFEELAKANSWSDEQEGLIYYNLILGNQSMDLTKNSYKALKKELLNIKYPKTQIHVIKRKLESIKQNNFRHIKEYFEEIKDLLYGYSIARELTKKEVEHCELDFFLNGLGKFTSIKVVEQNLHGSSLKDIYNYLQRFEEGIIMQQKDFVATNFVEKDKKINSKRYCSFCKSNTHYFSECFKRPRNNKQSNKTSVRRYCENCKTNSHDTGYCYKNKEEKMNLIMEELSGNEKNEIEINGIVNNKDVYGLIDTGSNLSYVNSQTAKDLNLIVMESKPIVTMFGNGKTISSCETVEIDIKLGENYYKMRCHVVKELPVQLIIGNDFIFSNGLTIDTLKKEILFKNGNSVSFVNKFTPIEERLDDILDNEVCMLSQVDQLNKDINVYKVINDKFKNINCSKIEIKVKEKIPTLQTKSYPIPSKYLKEARTEIKRLLDEDIIEYSNSNVVSPAFFIRKKNYEIRLVIDYQKINEYIENDPFHIPKMDELIRNMGINNFFSQIDLKNGFNQLPLAEVSRPLTSFILDGQQYQYKRMPFGIKPGPKIFQRNIARILRGIDNCFVYIDDILIFNKSEEEHVKTLRVVLERLRMNHVKINFQKSNIKVNKVKILGYTVSKDGISPDLGSLNKDIFNKEIKTKKQVQSLIGVLNWYRKFIPNLSVRISDITNLLKKNIREYRLTEAQKDKIFEIVEEVKGSKLCFPDYTQKFMLQCDASKDGIGSVLLQKDKIIGYYSKKFSGPELNYTVVEKEFFAMLLSLIYFQDIIQGSFIEVYTDNNNCTFNLKKFTSRMLRWKVLMSKFNYKIYHISGEINCMADTLSRCFIGSTQKIKNAHDDIVEECCMIKNNKYVIDQKGRLVLRPEKHLRYLKMLHNMSGHKGISTLYYNVKNNIYISNIRNKLQKILLECRVCKKYKIENKKNIINQRINANQIFETISTDIFGPFPLETFSTDILEETGYILSITDVFSRVTKLYFATEMNSEETIKFFENWCNIFNPPKNLISDNGKQYVSKKFKDFLISKEIRHTLIPIYTPSSNGISERINKTISFILSINKGNDILAAVKEAERSLNINYNRNIGSTPYRIYYGKDFFDIRNRAINYVPNAMNTKSNTLYKVGDRVHKRIFKSNKLGPKYSRLKKIVEVSKKGTWVKLNDENSWTHIKHLKLGESRLW